MSSYEKQFYRQDPSLTERLRRNVDLVRWLAGFLFAWLGPGRKLRKAYREAQRSGEPIVLEDFLDDGPE